MEIDEEIIFDNGIPNRDIILAEAKRISGLDDLKWNDRKAALIHSDFEGRRFDFYDDGNSLHICRGWTDKWYLLDVTLSALVNLGGRYAGIVPETGNKKWIDVKDQYPPLRHFRKRS